jgi:hypothetical protein
MVPHSARDCILVEIGLFAMHLAHPFFLAEERARLHSLRARLLEGDASAQSELAEQRASLRFFWGQHKV